MRRNNEPNPIPNFTHRHRNSIFSISNNNTNIITNIVANELANNVKLRNQNKCHSKAKFERLNSIISSVNTDSGCYTEQSNSNYSQKPKYKRSCSIAYRHILDIKDRKNSRRSSFVSDLSYLPDFTKNFKNRYQNQYNSCSNYSRRDSYLKNFNHNFNSIVDYNETESHVKRHLLESFFSLRVK